MATGGLYGQSSAGIISPQSGSESSGLYGNNTVFGGTYFEWFIFQEAATQPATPTGGSWNFLTNTGTVPSGWTQSPPSAPTNEIWVSIALVNSKTTSSFTWSTPGLLGVVASTNVGTTTTGAAGTSASVVNSGTAIDAVLNFTIPRGDTGATGPTGATGTAATIAAGTTTTSLPGTSASVINSGTSSAAVFDFTIPRGDVGATGPTGATGATGAAATIAAGTTTTTAPGTSATVTNVGTSGAAIFDFDIPRGAGVNSGGSAGQVLAKASSTDYDTTWINIVGGLNYQGTWNAATNTPTLTSSVGTNGYYYIVDAAGSTNLNGITDWVIGDWAIFNGSTWQKIDQTNLVTSVAGRTGAVVLANTDISGLGTMSTQNASSVAVTGGSIDGTTLGSTTRAAIAGTTELIGPAASANFTRFPNALSVVSNTAAPIQQNESAYIGQMAEGVSVGSTWGVGVYGAGYTNASGTGRGTGVTGEGHVSTAADTGVAVGVRGYATDAHTGNYNIGLYGDAENGDAGLTYGGNVALFLANGNIVTSSSAEKTWYMNGKLTFSGAYDLTIPQAKVTGGAIDNTVIGATTAAAGTFTTLTATADSSFTSTGAVKLASGTTAQRPTGVAGKLRFNTTTNEFEGYNGTTWASVGGAGISNDTSTATSVYPLFASATSGTASTLYTSNAKYLYTPSNGELQAGEMYANNGVLTHANQVTTNYIVPTGANVITVGPWTVASGATFTLSSGSRQVLL